MAPSNAALSATKSVRLSPFASVGASCVSMYVSKALRVIGPSITQGALSSWQRRPAMKVCVFQWPKGAAVRKRWPLRLRPRRRVILVLT